MTLPSNEPQKSSASNRKRTPKLSLASSSGASEAQATEAVAFEDYTFDLSTCALTYRGMGVRLEPRVAKLFAYLLENAGRVVPREELLQQLWPESTGTDTALNYAVSSLRRALSGCRGRPVAAIRGRGYRFDPPLSKVTSKKDTERLIDRASELQTLRRATAVSAERRTTRFVLVSGIAGIGKSRLVQELQAEWLQRGEHCLLGHCMDPDASPPLWPWHCVLEDSNRLSRRRSRPPVPPVSARRVASRFELPVSQADRYEYYSAVRERLEQIASKHPLLVMLEDIHRADDASLTLLEFLTKAVRPFPIVFLATCRTPLAQSSEPAIQQATARAEVVALSGLSEIGSRRFLRGVLGAEPEAEVEQRILQSSGGNPLFLKEIAFSLQMRPEQALHHLLPSSPSGVRDSIHWHLSTLNRSTLDVLRVASVAGEEFSVRHVSALFGGNVASVIEALSLAVRSQIVRPISSLEYCFTHTLFHQYVYEAIPEAERRQHHWKLGKVLMAAGQHRSGRGLSRTAHHLAEGALTTERAAEAAEMGALSADSLVKSFAFDTAAREYQRTLQLAEAGGSSVSFRLEVLLRAADCLRVSGNRAESKRLASKAVELARAHDDGVAFGEAACAVARSEIEMIGMQSDPVPVLQEALARVPSGQTDLRARLLAQLAQSLYFSPHVEQRLAACEEALALSQTADGKTRAFVLSARAFARWGLLSEKRQWQSELDAATLASQRANEPELELQVSMLQLVWALESGQVELAERRERLLFSRNNEIGNALIRYLLEVYKACVSILRGEPEAERLCRSALEIGKPSVPLLAEHACQAQLCMLSWEQGRDAVQQLLELTREASTHPGYLAPMGMAYALAGKRQRTCEIYEMLASAGFPLSNDNAALSTLSLSAELCAYTTDRANARFHYERLLPFAGHIAVTGAGITVTGFTSYALARLAALLGLNDAAHGHLVATRDLAVRLRSPAWIRRCDVGLERLARGAGFEDWKPRSIHV